MDEPHQGPDDAAPGGEPAGGPSPGETPFASKDLTKDERLWAMFAHLSGLIAGLLTGGVLGFLGPLIIWLVKKEESPFVDDQGKEALNFQLTLLIAYFAAWAVAMLTCGLGVPLLLVPFVLQVVFAIISAIRANEGEYYRYPLNIRFIT